MKKYIYYTYMTLIAFLIGCSDFGNVDKSPNGSVTPLTSALLTNALTQLGGSTAGGLSPLYCQYTAETQYTDASRYSLQDVNWTELSGTIYDIQNIIKINSDPATTVYAALNGSNNNQLAIARILKAYRYSIVTDRYGDMPYSEALTGNAAPKFDTQQSIYTDLFKELSEAVDQFDNGAPFKGDILFGGDKVKWQKFANSFRLILALRVSKVDATLGKAQFIAALAATGGVLSSVADDVNITYPGVATGFPNPWYNIGADDNISTTMVAILNTSGDARKSAFGIPVNGLLVGMDYGLPRQDAITYTGLNPTHSLILNTPWRLSNSTLTILTYGDVLLARAEAAELTWTAENANQLYADGIKASWEHWGVFSQGVYDGYMTTAFVDLANLSIYKSRLEHIGVQRWLSFYPNGPQGWSEWRRTGFPVLAPAPSPNLNPTGSQKIPVRYIYPTGEYNLNGANVAAAVALLEAGDTYDSHVWWDK